MDCPACKGTMVVAEYDKIEVDYCTKCFGVWFDSGELELLLEGMSFEDAGLSMKEIMNLPDAPVAEKGRRCPVCGRKMRKAYIGSPAKVPIDVCPQGDGLWFDSGELDQVIEQIEQTGAAPTGKREKIVGFLGEVFKARHEATSHSGGTA